MTAAEFQKVRPKNNWMPEVKKGCASILIGYDDPPVPIAHFAVRVVHALKVYGQYGQLTKQYEMGYKVINYTLTINRIFVPHKKLGGQRLHSLNREMLQGWIKNLCDNFSGIDFERYLKGDGNAPMKIAGGETSVGVADSTVQAADHMYQYHLYCITAQKQAGLHKTTDEVRVKELQRNYLMNNINNVTSGKYIINFHSCIV